MPAPQPALDPVLLKLWTAVDPHSLKVMELARKVAGTAATVLIRGESGTGKDQLAQLIHYLSPARDQPFLKIDCASLPAELVESELFGHERGAFTGAESLKRGRLELAGNGTIVLDEVAALTVAVQAKLLRVIEEKKFERLGGSETLQISARLIALTNADLERAVALRHLREDLYYRLNVFPIVVPPLRNRRADILPLARHLLENICALHRLPKRSLSPGAAAALEAYDFPGNVRELKNMLERAAIFAPGQEIGADLFPAHLGGREKKETKTTLQEMERQYIAEVLDYTRGKKTRAAQILGISRKTLLEKRKRYHLDGQEAEGSKQ
jgi:DNA-binding NtrC family response regulator